MALDSPNLKIIEVETDNFVEVGPSSILTGTALKIGGGKGGHLGQTQRNNYRTTCILA